MGAFLTSGEYLHPVNNSAVPSWLELTASWVGLNELLAPY